MKDKECYISCIFKRGAFSSERYLEFFAIGGEKENFNEKSLRGVLIGSFKDIIIDINEGYRHIDKKEESGEGYVRCAYVKPDNGNYRIGLSDCLAHKMTLFIVPLDSLNYIPINKISK